MIDEPERECPLFSRVRETNGTAGTLRICQTIHNERERQFIDRLIVAAEEAGVDMKKFYEQYG